MPLSPPLETRPTAQAMGIYYRTRAKMWRENAMAVPDGAPLQASYRELAEGYDRLAALYERRAQREQNLKLPA